MTALRHPLCSYSTAAYLAAAAILWVGLAAAQSADPEPATRLDVLLAQEAERGGDPEFDYQLGVASLKEGRADIALSALERVVLRRPDHAGAWIDLAIAHRMLGDLDSARAILSHVQAQFDPPPALLRQLEDAQRDLRRQTREAGWQVDAGVQAGYVQNANGGLTLGSINLTPGGVQVPVELDPSQRARGDRAVQYRAGAYRLWRGAGGDTTEAFAALRSRQFDSEADFDFTDMGAGLQHTRPLRGDLAAFVGGSVRHLRLGSAALANFRMVQGGLRYALGVCSANVRLEYERRDYVASGFAPADIPWVGGGVDCAPGWIEAGINLRSGRDTPDALRAGGATRRAEFTAYARRGLPWGWTGEATLYLARNRDHAGYSPLLDNGARREVDRTGYRFSLSRPVGGQSSPWILQMDYERAVDRSNLELFGLQDRVLLLGLRYRFQ